MRLIFLVLCTALAALTAQAQEPGARWEVLGTFIVDLDGEMAELYAVRDAETGEATVARTFEEDQMVLRIAGVTPGKEGNPGVPILTITLGPVGILSAEVRQVELREADRVLMASTESETEARVSDLMFGPGDAISFTFSADLVVMAPTADGANAPVPGAVGLPITGRFVGVLPGL